MTVEQSERTNDLANAAVLEAENLSVQFRDRSGDWMTIVQDVGFTLRPGETLGVVGESGSGKSVTAQALLGLVPEIGGRVTGGRIRVDGNDVLAMSQRELNRMRGVEVGMVFQQPTRCLNPSFRVGEQIASTVQRHLGLDRKASWAKAVEMLDRVGIPDAAGRAHRFPHEFSGGQAQRVMIALALSCSPKVLIADEPTTALDVTVQARIIELLRDLQSETGVAIMLVSHDLSVIAELSDRIMVMYAGQVVEQGQMRDVARNPRHPYTEALIKAIPRGNADRLVTIPGSLPSFDALPSGCRFHPRCAYAVAGLCTDEPIRMRSGGTSDVLPATIWQSRCVLASDESNSVEAR